MFAPQQAYRQRLIALGLCPRHGKAHAIPVVPGRRHCRGCIRKAVARSRVRRAGLKGYGLCIDCGEADVLKFARCVLCRDTLNRRRRRRYRELARCA